MSQRLSQRKDCRFSCRYKEKYFYGKTMAEAIRKRDNYKYRCEHEIGEIRHMTVRDYADEWLPNYKAGVQQDTYRQYESIVKRLCDAIGDYHLSSVTPDDVARVWTEYVGKSKSMVTKAGQLYRGLFDAAIESGYTRTNPFRSTVVKPPKGTAASHRAITAEERKLIETVPHRLQKAAMIMLYAGLRRGELLALQYDNVDNDVITVDEAISFAQTTPTVKGPKNDSSIRKVPLLEPIKKYFEDEDQVGYVVTSADGLMCTESAWDRGWESYIGELERAVNGCYKRWYHLTQEWRTKHPDEYDHYLKLKKKRPDQAEQYRLRGWKNVNIRPHDLRHSFCEWCITNGVDPKTVSSWMGHSDQKMIMQVYDHVTNERETKAVEKLNALFPPKSEEN
ncbi:MAG: site-specific integrase [Anaerolineaceae bacterium]|nr:site-specific integrase [Anaerolineaceae bacterium]